LAFSVVNLYVIRFFFTLPGSGFFLDIKYFFLNLKNAAAFFNKVVFGLRKYILFIYNERFLNGVKSLIRLVDALLSKFLFWRPLFKRFSYLGNFKLTNSKLRNL
jgi:hypothetical protein